MGDTEFDAAARMALAELLKITEADLAAPAWIMAWLTGHYPAVALQAATAYHQARTGQDGPANA